MRIYYECGYRWKGRKVIDHPARCPNPKCNSTDIRLAGSRMKISKLSNYNI